MGFFPERTGNVRKIISRVSEKRSIGFNVFIPFIFVHDYLIDDQTSLEYRSVYARFSGICLLGVKATDLVYLIVRTC